MKILIRNTFRNIIWWGFGIEIFRHLNEADVEIVPVDNNSIDVGKVTMVVVVVDLLCGGILDVKVYKVIKNCVAKGINVEKKINRIINPFVAIFKVSSNKKRVEISKNLNLANLYLNDTKHLNLKMVCGCDLWRMIFRVKKVKNHLVYSIRNQRTVIDVVLFSKDSAIDDKIIWSDKLSNPTT